MQHARVHDSCTRYSTLIKILIIRYLSFLANVLFYSRLALIFNKMYENKLKARNLQESYATLTFIIKLRIINEHITFMSLTDLNLGLLICSFSLNIKQIIDTIWFIAHAQIYY